MPMAAYPAGAWERRMLPAVTVGAVRAAGVIAVVTVAIKHGPAAPAPSSTSACARLAAAWMLWMFTLHPAWRERPRPMAVFFAGAPRDHGAPGAQGSLVRLLHARRLLLRVPVLPLAVAAGGRRRGRGGGRHRAGGRHRQGRPSWACSAYLAIVAVNVRADVRAGLARPASATQQNDQREQALARAERGQPAAGGDAGRERGPARSSCWPRPGRPGCSTSGSGWPGRSTTPWPRG